MDHNLDFLKAGKHTTTQSFVDLNLDIGLFPTVTRPMRITHTSATLIDNIMINKSLYDKHCIAILLSDLSNHLPCLLTVSNTKKSKQEPMYRTICDTSDKAMKSLNHDLKGINWNTALDNVDDLFNDFHNKVQQQIDKHCPEKVIHLSPKSIRKEPWLTKGIINSSKKQLFLFKEYLSNSCSHDEYQLYRQMLQRIKWKAKQEYYTDQCNKFCNNTTRLWKILNEVLSKSNDKDSVPTLKANGINYHSKSVISNEFAEYFANIGNKLSNNIPNGAHNIDYYLQRINKNPRSLFITPCTELEIERILSSLKNKPSSGYDDISNKVLKVIGISLLTPLCHIFNESIKQGVFPLAMKNAIVMPLYKAGP